MTPTPTRASDTSLPAQETRILPEQASSFLHAGEAAAASFPRPFPCEEPEDDDVSVLPERLRPQGVPHRHEGRDLRTIRHRRTRRLMRRRLAQAAGMSLLLAFLAALPVPQPACAAEPAPRSLPDVQEAPLAPPLRLQVSTGQAGGDCSCLGAGGLLPGGREEARADKAGPDAGDAPRVPSVDSLSRIMAELEELKAATLAARQSAALAKALEEGERARASLLKAREDLAAPARDGDAAPKDAAPDALQGVEARLKALEAQLAARAAEAAPARRVPEGPLSRSGVIISVEEAGKGMEATGRTASGRLVRLRRGDAWNGGRIESIAMDKVVLRYSDGRRVSLGL